METKKHEKLTLRRRRQTCSIRKRHKEEIWGLRRKKVRFPKVSKGRIKKTKTSIIFGLLIEKETMERSIHRQEKEDFRIRLNPIKNSSLRGCHRYRNCMRSIRNMLIITTSIISYIFIYAILFLFSNSVTNWKKV